MPSYQHVTDPRKINREIIRHLHDVEAAQEIVAVLTRLCSTAEVSTDPVVHWLGLLNRCGIPAASWLEHADGIVIEPSPHPALGLCDHLWVRVGNPKVAIVKVSHGLQYRQSPHQASETKCP